LNRCSTGSIQKDVREEGDSRIAVFNTSVIQTTNGLYSPGENPSISLSSVLFFLVHGTTNDHTSYTSIKKADEEQKERAATNDSHCIILIFRDEQ
jgi:hypothetical protein